MVLPGGDALPYAFPLLMMTFPKLHISHRVATKPQRPSHYKMTSKTLIYTTAVTNGAKHSLYMVPGTWAYVKLFPASHDIVV